MSRSLDQKPDKRKRVIRKILGNMTNPKNQLPLADHRVNYKNMKKEMKTKVNFAVELGRLGGRATVKKKGKKYMSEIGKRGAKIRWSKIK